MLEKIDKIQELLNVPNVDASTENAIANMKILNLLVDLRAEAEQLILSGVSKSVVCGNCDGWGYTVDENGRRKEHCKECE